MTAAENRKRFLGRASLTTWSVLGLAVGLLVGLNGRASPTPFFADLARAIKPVGEVWLTILQIAALPLVLTDLLAAITGSRGSESVATGEVSGVSLR